MVRRPTRFQRTATLFPYTPRRRSWGVTGGRRRRGPGGLSRARSIFVSLAGSLFALALRWLPMRTLWGSDWIFDQSRYVVYAIYFLQFQNLWWSVANLLPIRPLDGGNVTAELFGLDSARRISIGEIGRASCRERGCQYVSISVVAG